MVAYKKYEYNTSTGKRKQVTSTGKHGMCPSCGYEASDGNEYSDTFGTLDAGWLFGTGETWKVSGGNLQLDLIDLTADGHSVAYRNKTITLSGLKVIIEASTGLLNDSTDTGIFFAAGLPSAFNQEFALTATTASGGQFEAIAFGSSIYTGGTPSGYQKLTLSVEHLSATTYLACFYVDEIEIASKRQASYTLSTSQKHGLYVEHTTGIPRTTDRGDWEDYSIHVGNP